MSSVVYCKGCPLFPSSFFPPSFHLTSPLPLPSPSFPLPPSHPFSFLPLTLPSSSPPLLTLSLSSLSILLLLAPPSRQLMLEYNDALNRVRCLAVSHDLLLAEKAPPTSLVEEGDVVPYLRWRVYHQHVTKNMAAFLMVCALHVVCEGEGGGRGCEAGRGYEPC